MVQCVVGAGVIQGVFAVQAVDVVDGAVQAAAVGCIRNIARIGASINVLMGVDWRAELEQRGRMLRLWHQAKQHQARCQWHECTGQTLRCGLCPQPGQHTQKERRVL